MNTIHDMITQAIRQLEAALPISAVTQTVSPEDLRTTARLEAEILLAHALGESRTWLRTWPERTPSAGQQSAFQQFLNRRCTGEPIAYILGQRAFRDFELEVTPDTLIPRPETEQLVELALQKIPSGAQWQLADPGTGSGAIAIALAKERPRCHIIATDSSAAALEVARNNAARQHISNIEFRHGAWFAPLIAHRFQLIATNPPYVAEQDPHLHQGDLRFEPREALISGADGLDDIRHIIRLAPEHLVPGGWLIMEHGFDQGDAVVHLLNQRGFCQAACQTDYAGNDRISVGQWPG